jgi:hypothetical protein
MSNIAVADSVQVRTKAPEVQSNQKDTRVAHHRINKVAVLGAGTMGSRIAAHLANAGIPCYLLDIVPPDQAQSSDKSARNKIVAAGLDGAIKSKPAAFFQKGLERLVTIGNFDDDLKLLADADWIIEAVAENLEIKRNLLKKVEAVRKSGSIVTTNTSGLPVHSIAEGFGLVLTSSIRPAICGCWRSFPHPKAIPRQLPTLRIFAMCGWVKESFTPKTLLISSPIGLAHLAD